MSPKPQTQPIHLPPFANYDCVMCGWCCRQFDITFSEADHRKLAQKDWRALVPEIGGQAWCRPTRKRPPKDPWRFVTRPDGSCVFLGDGGGCLMHTHTTEMGKALACTTFPFTIASTPTGMYAGLRYSCKSVAERVGPPVTERLEFVQKLAKRLADEGHSPRYGDTVDYDGERALAWSDYLKLEDALIATFLRQDMPLTHRVVMAWRVVSLVDKLDPDRLKGSSFQESLHKIVSRLGEEFPGLDIPKPALKPREKVMFRQFVSNFHRRADTAYFSLNPLRKARERARWFFDGVRFAKGSGRVRLHDTGQPVSLDDVASVRLPPLTAEQDHMLSRFLAGKLFGKQVFGKLFFGYPFRPGFTFLVLAHASALWLARALALARGRDRVSDDDIAWAIRHVDFCYNYTKVHAKGTERMRVATLQKDDSAARLAVAYGDDRA